MHKIESKEDFSRWMNDVNASGFIKAVALCDLQDVFARSDVKALKGFFVDMDQNEKELGVFCIQKAMGSATLFDFIKTYARHRFNEHVQSEYAEVDKRNHAVAIREIDLVAREQTLQQTIDNLRYQNGQLVKYNDKVNKEASDYVKRIYSLENEVDELESEIKELRSFESHIKELLAA